MATLIGFDMCHYALLTEDSTSTNKATYGAPKRIIGAIQANINPNSSDSTLFGDNGPMESASALGKIELELGCVDFPFEVQAEMLGHTVKNGLIVRKGADTAPWLAIGGRCLKSNGHYRYFWLLKGKMTEPGQKKETKKDKVEFQTPTMKGAFVKRDCDDAWLVEYDDDAVGADSSIIKTWFTTVPDPETIITKAN